jgi:glycosyltransferase involved in cell wall biosynthesis
VGRFLAGTPRLAREIGRLVEQVQADLVYVNGPRLVPAAALARVRVPILFHAHSYVAPGPLRRIIGSGLRKAKARVIASCEFVAAAWRAYLPRDHVTVIYNGVAGPAELHPAASFNRALTVGCIGRIAPEKGQLEFVRAAAISHAAVPYSRFLIYGAALFDDPDALRYEAELRAAATGLPVEFHGWSHSVYAALANLDLLLVPSAGHEATTRVILEAFAAGVPVIAFRSGGIPEVMDAGFDGCLVDNAEEMAREAIGLLTGPPERRISLSQAARLTWERRFTKERYHEQLLEMMQRTLKSREPK